MCFLAKNVNFHPIIIISGRSLSITQMYCNIKGKACLGSGAESVCWRRSSPACCVSEGGGVICDGSQFVQWAPLHHSFNSVQFAANHRAQHALLQTSIILLPTLKDLSFLRNQSLLAFSSYTAFRFSLLHGNNHSNQFYKHRKLCKLPVFSQE